MLWSAQPSLVKVKETKGERNFYWSLTGIRVHWNTFKHDCRESVKKRSINDICMPFNPTTIGYTSIYIGLLAIKWSIISNILLMQEVHACKLPVIVTTRSDVAKLEISCFCVIWILDDVELAIALIFEPPLTKAKMNTKI